MRPEPWDTRSTGRSLHANAKCLPLSRAAYLTVPVPDTRPQRALDCKQQAPAVGGAALVLGDSLFQDLQHLGSEDVEVYLSVQELIDDFNQHPSE